MASYQYVYVMQGLTKAYGNGKKVLENVTLSFLPGAKIGVLGPNGSGKSTLLRIMAGRDKDFMGEAWSAEGARVGYLEQEPQLDPKKNVHENVMEGLKDIKAMVDRFNKIGEEMAEDGADFEKLSEEMGDLQTKIDAVDGWELDRTIEMAMDALRCPPGEAKIDKLSGGEKRRVALCKLLLEKPDMLLLDEPTNHLDAESVAWLQRFLGDYKGTVVMITHDRYFLDNVTGWILELDRGRGIPYEGNYTGYLKAKAKRLEQESKEEAVRQKTIAKEMEWMGKTPEGRRKKSKARIASYEQLLQESQNATQRGAQIVIPTPPRLGQNVIEAKNISKGYGDVLLIDNLSFNLPPGGIVGVIGPNGAGKTTLFRMITGTEKPDTGTFKVAESVKLGYVDQSRDSLNGDNKFRTRKTSSSSGKSKCRAAPMSRRSTSAAPTSSKKSAPSPAARETACISQRCSRPKRTLFFSTNRPTISTRKHCRRWKKRWRISRAAPLSSRTTAGSSTASPRIFSRSRATATSNGLKEIMKTTKKTANAALVSMPISHTGSSINP
jgi:sulfate-transporting ATPase